MELDLTNGIGETDQYKAWVFPGGEIHLKIKYLVEDVKYVYIKTRLNTSQDIMLLILAVDTIKKDSSDVKINLFLPYMPYQQADRNFGHGECFSLKTMCNLLNSMELNKITIYDAHSDVTPALLNNSVVIDNSNYITKVLQHLAVKEEDLIILSPDAGAYKKIFKLCEKIGFKGQIESCSKTREHGTEKPTVKVPEFDKEKSVLIIDDICLGGRTFIDIASKIENKCYLAISHGVFDSGGYGDPVPALIEAFDGIYSSNSRKDVAPESGNGKITIIDIF